MSPLFRRLPRDFIHNLGKYLGIFLLMALATAFTAGFLQAAASIKVIADGMRETYNIEDFYFTTMYEMDDEDIRAIEDKGAHVYENFSRDVEIEVKGDSRDISVRLYVNRGKDFNQVVYAEGRAPETDGEVALDRVFCANHNLLLGDTVTIEGETFELVGICTLADYSVTYKSSGDFMFNAVTFTVAQVCEETFDRLVGDAANYRYSVLLDDREMSLADRIDFEEDLVDILVDRDVTVTDLIDAESNIGLTFAPEDVDGDMTMWEILMMILVVVMAFVFVVLTDATIEQESAVIGTLLASGYRKRELMLHYLVLPMLIGLAGVVVGNIAGVTILRDPMQGLYYNSYSFPPFKYHWNWPVFFLTSVLPLVTLLVITFFGLARKLGATPLQFLRHEAGGRVRGGGATLPEKLPYTSRFRLRVFLRNISHFATLFVGIMFGSILLLLGLCMLPIVDYNAELMAKDVPAEHLYMLKSQITLDATDKERAAWAAAEELVTNPAYDALNLDLVGEIGDKLEAIGLNFDQFSGDEEADFELPQEIDDAIEASVDEDTDFEDPLLLAQVRAFAQFAGIELEDATDAQLSDVLAAADTFHKQIHELDDEHMELASDLLEDIMAVDELPEDPVNQTAIPRATLDQVERYGMATLALPRRLGDKSEDITIYGIAKNSRYWSDIAVSDGRVLVGEGVLAKCKIELGESAVFTDRFTNDTYTITCDDTCGNGTTMAIYMTLDDFNTLFDNDDDYYNGFASNEELELDARYVASEITPDKMLSVSTQMQDSMSSIMGMMVGLVIPIYLVLIYLLTKTVIERSARSISYMKVFGYHNREIDRLYIRSITVTVVASLVLCLPLIVALVDWLVPRMMSGYSGNFVMWYPPQLLARIVIIGLATYAVVAVIHVMRIRRVLLSLAMKVQE